MNENSEFEIRNSKLYPYFVGTDVPGGPRNQKVGTDVTDGPRNQKVGSDVPGGPFFVGAIHESPVCSA